MVLPDDGGLLSAPCPYCKSPLPPDFGLVSCAQCGAAVMLDEEGQISSEPNEEPDQNFFANQQNEFLSEEAQSEMNEADENALFQSGFIDNSSQNDAADFGEEFEQAENSVESFPDEPNDSFSMGLKDDGTHVAEFESLGEEEVEPVEGASHLEEVEQLETEKNLEDSELNFDSVPTENTDLEDLSEIADYGNSPISQAAEGSLFYSVIIEDIDTAEHRHYLKEELSDPKFMWNVEDLMRTIKNGRLELSHVSAVKAAILLHRLIRSELKLSWSQHLLQSTPNFEETS